VNSTPVRGVGAVVGVAEFAKGVPESLHASQEQGALLSGVHRIPVQVGVGEAVSDGWEPVFAMDCGALQPAITHNRRRTPAVREGICRKSRITELYTRTLC
jgi:hypothetical protein